MPRAQGWAFENLFVHEIYNLLNKTRQLNEQISVLKSTPQIL
jgi:hypothetical protein